MIKLIATDMDGTLLNEKGEINKEFIEVFNKLKEKNIIFCAASGRQYYNLLEKFNETKEDMLFIAENGSYVGYKGEEVFSKTLSLDLAKEFLEVTRGIEEAYPVYCGKRCAYIENDDKRLIKEIEKYYAEYQIVDDLSKIDDEILKFTICDFISSEKNSFKYFKKYMDVAKVTVSGEIWLDICNKEVNKGVAIQKVQEKFNITKEETMVFGDYLNDVELLQSAGYSFAMENAHEDLKKIAKYRAKSNVENGVLEAIKEYVLNS